MLIVLLIIVFLSFTVCVAFILNSRDNSAVINELGDTTGEFEAIINNEKYDEEII